MVKSWWLAALVAGALACGGEVQDEGLGMTPALAEGEEAGPVVLFDPTGDPLLRQPFPSNLLTRPDPHSATGRRLNLPAGAARGLERQLMEQLNELDGFSTFGPIRIPFSAPLDLEELVRRHQDNLDFSDDAVYLVELATGRPVQLDLGRGNYPPTQEEPGFIFLTDAGDFRPWDRHQESSNLLFEGRDEDLDGDGELDPDEDGDDDSLLDRPNTRPGTDPYDPWAHYTGLLHHYERESNTLILRPLEPLLPGAGYAVVLTGRLGGHDKRPVRSPFAAINHLSQGPELAPLKEILTGPPYGLHFGSQGEAELDHVAFAFSFVTQTTSLELLAVADGLAGRGALAALATDFPPEIEWRQLRNDEEGQGGALFAIDGEAVKLLAEVLAPTFFGSAPESVRPRMVADFDHVGTLALGSLAIPDLLCRGATKALAKPAAGVAKADCTDLTGASAELADRSDERWRLAPDRSEVRACPDRVPLLLTIPREGGGHRQPFPVALYFHELGGSRLDSLAVAAHLARQGIATVALDGPGHGPRIAPGELELLEHLLETPLLRCAPLAAAMAEHRNRDLRRDGSGDDGGGDFWGADPLLTRDLLRQWALEGIQAVHALRRYDGKFKGWNVTDHPGRPAGDFDGNGVPDLGGPLQVSYALGEGLGGMAALLAAAAAPEIGAVATASAGGGMADIVARSQAPAVRRGLHRELFGPAVLLGPLDDQGQPTPAGQLFASLLIGRFNQEALLPVGPLPAEPGELLELVNLATGAVSAGTVDLDGHLLLPIAASALDPLAVRAGDGGKVRLDRWSRPVAFQGLAFCPGQPLVAPTAGWGLWRNRPEVGRYLTLFQLAADGGDPVNFARHFFREPGHQDQDGNPLATSLLLLHPAGDQELPVSAGLALARAAGVLDFDGRPPRCPGVDGPDTLARYGLSGNDLLIANGVAEGLEQLQEHKAWDPLGKSTDNGEPGPTWGLFDADDLDEAADGWQAPSPEAPLRWTRLTLTPVQVEQWAGAGCPELELVAGSSGLRLPYIEPWGGHGLRWPEPPVNGLFFSRFHSVNQMAWFLANGEIRDDLCLEDEQVCQPVAQP